jgi:hypothetical protein
VDDEEEEEEARATREAREERATRRENMVVLCAVRGEWVENTEIGAQTVK